VAPVFQDPMTRLNPLMTIGKHRIETLCATNLSVLAVSERKVLTTLE